MFYSNSMVCSCKLAITMKNFITNRGGTSKSTQKFVISSDYLKLIIDDDISLLDNITDYLSINALNVFRLWYIHNHIL